MNERLWRWMIGEGEEGLRRNGGIIAEDSMEMNLDLGMQRVELNRRDSSKKATLH